MASGHGRYIRGAKMARWVWTFALIYRSLVRALITSAALAAGVLLTGCNSDEISLATNAKANQPVPPKLLSDMAPKDMDLNSPILVRLFKQEAELEVWKQDRSGRFALLKTYPICRWSGDLGPKVREGAPQPLRQGAGTHWLAADGAWRLLVARLLRDDRRADRGNLFAGTGILLRRPARVPAAGLSVQDDAGEHGEASQQPEHAVLENDQGRLGSFRSDAAGAEGRFLREEIRIRRRQAVGRHQGSGIRRLGQMPRLCDPG